MDGIVRFGYQLAEVKPTNKMNRYFGVVRFSINLSREILPPFKKPFVNYQPNHGDETEAGKRIPREMIQPFISPKKSNCHEKKTVGTFLAISFAMQELEPQYN